MKTRSRRQYAKCSRRRATGSRSRSCSASIPGVIPASQRIADDASGPLHALRIVYRARVTGGRLRNEVGGSTDRAEWFPLAAVEALQRVKLVDVALSMAGVR